MAYTHTWKVPRIRIKQVYDTGSETLNDVITWARLELESTDGTTTYKQALNKYLGDPDPQNFIDLVNVTAADIKSMVDATCQSAMASGCVSIEAFAEKRLKNITMDSEPDIQEIEDPFGP